jgi:hypothetical protein
MSTRKLHHDEDSLRLADFLKRSEALWREMVPQLNERLPFIKTADDETGTILSHWDVTSTGNKLDDATLGCFFAEALVHRAKNVRGDFDPFEMIVAVIRDLVSEGHFGDVEYGFFARLSILALAGSSN